MMVWANETSVENNNIRIFRHRALVRSADCSELLRE